MKQEENNKLKQIADEELRQVAGGTEMGDGEQLGGDQVRPRQGLQAEAEATERRSDWWLATKYIVWRGGW